MRKFLTREIMRLRKQRNPCFSWARTTKWSTINNLKIRWSQGQNLRPQGKQRWKSRKLCWVSLLKRVTMCHNWAIWVMWVANFRKTKSSGTNCTIVCCAIGKLIGKQWGICKTKSCWCSCLSAISPSNCTIRWKRGSTRTEKKSIGSFKCNRRGDIRRIRCNACTITWPTTGRIASWNIRREKNRTWPVFRRKFCR